MNRVEKVNGYILSSIVHAMSLSPKTKPLCPRAYMSSILFELKYAVSICVLLQ